MRQAAGNSQRELCRSAWRESSNPLVFTSRMSSSMVLLAHLGFFFFPLTLSYFFTHSSVFTPSLPWFIDSFTILKRILSSIHHPSVTTLLWMLTLHMIPIFFIMIFFPLILISINKKLIKIIKCRGPRASSQGTWVGEQQQMSGGGRGRGDEGCTPMMMDPDSLAQTYWHLHIQDRTAWTLEIDLRPSNAASLY